ncbi:hypothetical protein IJD44_11265 [bacterium]|nr:hypothetical protein [bacterium]
MKNKSVILIVISVLLFVYALLVGVIPSIMNKSFKREAFEKKLTEAIGLNTTIGTYTVRVKPNFETIVTITELKVEFPDAQPVFKAKSAELTTNYSSLFTKKYVVKNLDLRFVRYDDLILPDGQNKIGFLPSRITPKPFGTRTITIVAGPVFAKNIEISRTKSEPYSYKKESYRQLTYTKDQVRSFLSSLQLSNIKVK